MPDGVVLDANATTMWQFSDHDQDALMKSFAP